VSAVIVASFAFFSRCSTTAMSCYKDSKFGYIPMMAQTSKGQIGTYNAKIFCERCLSAGNHIMTEKKSNFKTRRRSILQFRGGTAGFFNTIVFIKKLLMLLMLNFENNFNIERCLGVIT
jgi:hypothetical protein